MLKYLEYALCNCVLSEEYVYSITITTTTTRTTTTTIVLLYTSTL